MPRKIISFGYRHGIPSIIHEDNILDIRERITRNPYHDERLKYLKGDNGEVITYIEEGLDTELAYLRIRYLAKECKGAFYVGCTGGHHRSVYIANRLGKDLGVEVVHLNYNDK